MSLILDSLREEEQGIPTFLILGFPGCGKTTLTLTMPRPVIVCADDAESIRKIMREHGVSIPYWPVSSDQEARKAISALANDDRFDTIVFDNLTVASDKWFVELKRNEGPDAQPDKQDYGIVLRRMKFLKEAAVHSGKLFFYYAHVREERINIDQSRSITKLRPGLVGQASALFPGTVQYVFFMERYSEKGQVVRVLHTEPYRGMEPKGSCFLEAKEQADMRVVLRKLGYDYPKSAYALANKATNLDICEDYEQIERVAPAWASGDLVGVEPPKDVLHERPNNSQGDQTTQNKGLDRSAPKVSTSAPVTVRSPKGGASGEKGAVNNSAVRPAGSGRSVSARR